MEKTKKEFFDQYRDPRWQRKRLEILERDEFTCQSCYNDTKTLNIHHCYYEEDKNPWDYPNEYLITLCEECHKEDKENRPDDEKWLLIELRRLFRCSSISDLLIAFHNMKLHALPDVVASVYAWAIENPDIQDELIEKYFAHLKEKHKKWVSKNER